MPSQPHASRLFSLLALAALSFAPVPAVQAQSATAPAANQPADPLKGPSVTDRDAPKGKGQSGFGADAIEKKKAAKGRPTPPTPMPEFLKSLDVLRSSPTPLTSEQETKIRTIAADFETAVKTYTDKNKAELDTLRAKLSPTDRAMLDQQLARGGPLKLSKAGFGGKSAIVKQKDKTPADATGTPTPSGGTQGTNEEAAKVRARLVEIYSGRPKSDDAQAKILGVLAPDQLKLVEAELAKHDVPTAAHGKGKRPKAK